MSIIDNKSSELISNIRLTLKIPFSLDNRLSKLDNLKKILLHVTFLKSFCNLHGYQDQSIHLLLEITSLYLDNTFIYKFYKDQNLNINVINDFNKIFVIILTNKQLYNENIKRFHKQEADYYKFLLQFYTILHRFAVCKEFTNIINLQKSIMNKLDKKDILQTFPPLVKRIEAVYTHFIIKKSEITIHYHNKIKNDKKIITQISNLVKDPCKDALKDLDSAFSRPIIHFFEYQSTFRDLQTQSFEHHETLSFLQNSFIEMTRRINDQMRMIDYEKLYASKRDKIEKIEELERYNTGSIELIITSEFVYRQKGGRYMLIFYRNGFAVIRVSRKYVFLEYISYNKVSKCKIYDEKDSFMVKIVYTAEAKQTIIAPIDTAEKTRIVTSLINKCKNGMNMVSYAAKIEFGDLLFLIQYNGSESLSLIKKKVIARVGRHFYSEKNIKEDKIDLSLYHDFHFYIRHDGNLYLLENDDDLGAAMMLTENKLDIVIRNKQDQNDLSNVS